MFTSVGQVRATPKIIPTSDSKVSAYCADPRFKKSGVENWTCKACAAYPGMEATTFTSKKDTNGYVGYYPTDNEIVIAFSGTNPFDIQEWIDDLDFIKTEYPYCTGCYVHEGFYKTFLAAKDEIINLTNSYMAKYPTATVTCTGHSLGAGMRIICFDIHHVMSGLCVCV